MSRVPQIWTNTDKEGKGTTLLPIVNADGKLMVDVDMATEGIATEARQIEEPISVGYTWTDGLVTEIVETYSDRTVTTTLTWVDGKLTNEAIVIT